MVTVTNGVTDSDGFAVGRDAEFRFAAEPALNNLPDELAQLNGLVNSQLNAYAAATMAPREDVVVSFTFTTQSWVARSIRLRSPAGKLIIGDLQLAAGTCGADTANDPNSVAQLRTVIGAPLIGTASELLEDRLARRSTGASSRPLLPHRSRQHGQLRRPDERPVPADQRVAGALRRRGVAERNLTRFNPLPISRSSQQVPVLISVPDPAITMPADGYPVVIFQHGITGNRASMPSSRPWRAPASPASRSTCRSMERPGETLPRHLLPRLRPVGDVWERTFGLDLLIESAEPAAVPDGTADSTGAHFINLTNLAVSRDNLRQSIADLFNLKTALSGLTILGMDVIDESEVHFMGHSLGGIVGTPFAANRST